MKRRLELRNYLLKRLLDGSTSDEPRLQDRYLTTIRLVLSDSELFPFFDNAQTLSSINDRCNATNAIKKSERKFFNYTHASSLLSFYFASPSTKLSAIKPSLDSLLQEFKDGAYFVVGYLTALTSAQLDKTQQDKVKNLIEELVGKKVTLDSFRHATFHLVLQNLAKSHKLKIENSKYELLENNCTAVVSSKNLSKYFDEILVDDSVNTSQTVPFFEAACTNILERNSEKPLAKLFKFFHQNLDTLEKDKLLRQKRAFHLVSFFREFVAKVDVQVLLAMDVDSILKKKQSTDGSGEKDSESIADIFVNLIDFWLKQLGNKNAESRQASVELDHVLAEKVRTLDKSVGQKLVSLLLRILKNNPTSSLRGGDLKLMQTLLGQLYQDDKLFQEYFTLLNSKLKANRKVAEINFYLNELEHLGQVGLSARLHKDLQGEKEVALRVSVLKALVDFFVHCESEPTLNQFFGEGESVEWNEQNLSFRKFRTKVFERINNLVFKRDDPLFLSKGADIFSKAATHYSSDLSSYFKTLKEAASKIDKNNPSLANLFRALTFMNIFEDDIEKNADIVGDLVKASQLMHGSAGPSPVKKVKPAAGRYYYNIDGGQQAEDVFVDGLIALCSTTQPQLKPLITHAFEGCCERVGKGGFSVLFQAILKPDTQYLKDEGEDEDENEDEEENGVDNEEEGEIEENEDEIDDDTNLLGKRPAKTEGKKTVQNHGEHAPKKHQNGVSKQKPEEHNKSARKEKKAGE